MITVRITFLLALNLKSEEKTPKKSKKSPRKRKKGSKKSSKSSKRSKKGSKSSKKGSKNSKKRKPKTKISSKEEVEEDYSIIQVAHPLNYIHIEYELFPKKLKYNLDIVCWGPTAKIYSSSGDKSLKTIVKNDIVWVPVFIEHYLDHLNTPEVEFLIDNHIIRFSIKFGKNHVGARAKNDKTTSFYDDKCNTGQEFSEVYSSLPPSDEKQRIQEEIERILAKILATPVGNETSSWIYSIDEAHAYRVSKILTKRLAGEEFFGRDCRSEHLKKSKKHEKAKSKSSKNTSRRSKSSKKTSRKSSKKSSKSSKGKTKEGSISFQIPGYILVSDPRLAIFHYDEINPTIGDLYILTSSENIITQTQKQELSPFVLKIRKVSNLPSEILKQKGFDKIYAKCTVPGITEFETRPQPIGGVVRFDDSRVVRTSFVPPIKLLDILQARRAFVEIFAIKEPPQKKPQPKAKKAKKAKVVSQVETKQEPVMLALATYDMSSLAKTFFLFKQKEQCYNLHSRFADRPDRWEDHFLDLFTVNELNDVVYPDRDNPSPLRDDVLIFNNTTVKFEAHFLVPQHPAFQLLRTMPITYKRIMAVIFNEGVAKNLFNEIIMFNNDFLGPATMLLPKMLTQKKDHSDQMLSGFVLDDGNCFIFYVEGLSNGYILHLIHEISVYSFPTAKVFYNSEYLFEKRQYLDFFNRIGFLIVNLKIPLKDIIRKQEVYVEGNVPMPCLLAIQKIDLILNSNMLKSILDYHLLPTEVELVSLSIEFGLQIEYKGFGQGEDYIRSLASSVLTSNCNQLF